MAPLIVQLVSWATFWLLGFTGFFPAAGTLAGALRFALAAMFAFTGVSHFLPRIRAELVQMVPPALPAPHLLVSVTGVLELVGAIGLLLPRFAWGSALGLTALLIALFPANMRAARLGLLVAGRRATPLVIRLPIQLFWIGCLLWTARSYQP